MTNIDALNDEFAIDGHVSFAEGPGGLPVAEINNRMGSATVCLLGAHVMSFQPNGAEPVLFLSKHARFEVGQPIRGGVPVCWPWFARRPDAPDKPLHGLVRTRLWEVVDVFEGPQGSTELSFAIRDDEETRAEWPHAFELEMTVHVGKRLRVELVTYSNSDEPFTITEALHHYFYVSNTADISIMGLSGAAYLDTTNDPPTRETQSGHVKIAGEVDNVYSDTESDLVINDPGLGRRIRIHKEGSRSTVVWNPWIEKSKNMADFGDDEYTHMVCVETANAYETPVTIEPGGDHLMAATVSVEPFG